MGWCLESQKEIVWNGFQRFHSEKEREKAKEFAETFASGFFCGEEDGGRLEVMVWSVQGVYDWSKWSIEVVDRSGQSKWSVEVIGQISRQIKVGTGGEFKPS